MQLSVSPVAANINTIIPREEKSNGPLSKFRKEFNLFSFTTIGMIVLTCMFYHLYEVLSF